MVVSPTPLVPIRNVMPCPPPAHAACTRHCRVRPESVVTQYTPLSTALLMMRIGTSDKQASRHAAQPAPPGRENGRVLRTCSQTRPTILPTPARPLPCTSAPSRLFSPCSCFLAAPRFRTLVVDLSPSPCLCQPPTTRRPGLDEPCFLRQCSCPSLLFSFQLLKYARGCSRSC